MYYKQVDERENLAELALEMRYTMNAKKVQASKLSKKKDRSRIRQAFHADEKLSQQRSDAELAKRLEKLNNYFMNR